jgi:Asp-tRNA(Asn)/Glu-tRNA(Gln) amidotransferase A subunit family amidase
MEARQEQDEDIAMTELGFFSAIEIAKQIREHRISSREALDYFLARVEALDRPIKSVVTIDAAERVWKPTKLMRPWLAARFADRCMACR